MSDFLSLNFFQQLLGALTVAAAIVAVFSRTTRVSIIALWFCGLGVAAFYLHVGAEFLAFVQTLVSTVIAGVFIAYALMLGGRSEGSPDYRWILTGSMGIGFFAAVLIAGKFEVLPMQKKMSDLAELGQALVSEYFLVLVVFSLLFSLVIVGSGTLARPEVGRAKK